MLYTVTSASDQVQLTIRTGDTPAASIGENVIGSWDGSVIRLYLNRITDQNMLFTASDLA